MQKYKDEFEFERKHRGAVSNLLDAEYHKKFESVYSAVKPKMDYAFYIGIPLLAIWVIWVSTANFNEYYIAGILLLFGLLLRWHCKFIVKLTVKDVFFETKVRIISEYLEPLMNSDIEQDPKNEAAIRKFYEKCEFFLISTNINIHKKPKE